MNTSIRVLSSRESTASWRRDIHSFSSSFSWCQINHAPSRLKVKPIKMSFPHCQWFTGNSSTQTGRQTNRKTASTSELAGNKRPWYPGRLICFTASPQEQNGRGGSLRTQVPAVKHQLINRAAWWDKAGPTCEIRYVGETLLRRCWGRSDVNRWMSVSLSVSAGGQSRSVKCRPCCGLPASASSGPRASSQHR